MSPFWTKKKHEKIRVSQKINIWKKYNFTNEIGNVQWNKHLVKQKSNNTMSVMIYKGATFVKKTST